MRKLMLLTAAVLSFGVVLPNAAQAQKVSRDDVIKRKDDVRVDSRRNDRRDNDDRDSDHRDSDRRNTQNRYVCYDRNGRPDANGDYDRYHRYDRNCAYYRDYYRRVSNNRNNNDRYDNDRNGKGGPAFCRSGAGHPVYGRQWCYNKGYGLGNDRNDRNDRNQRWDRVTWDDVIFRRRPNYSSNLGRNVLLDMLGSSVFNRIDAQRRYFGINAPLVGQWNSYEGNSVLLLNAGGIPIAELVDRNGDHRVDYILLNHR